MTTFTSDNMDAEAEIALFTGPDTMELLNYTSNELNRHLQLQRHGVQWPLGPVAFRMPPRFPGTVPPTNSPQVTATDIHTSVYELPTSSPQLSNHVNNVESELQTGQDVTPVSPVARSDTRSSFEILGCMPPERRATSYPGVGSRLSRPPSSMPYFGPVGDEGHLGEELDAVEQAGERAAPRPDAPALVLGIKSLVQLVVAVFLVAVSSFSTTAAGAVITVLRQVGKPVHPGYGAWLVLSIIVCVFSTAGLAYILRGSASFNWRPRRVRVPWTIRSPFARRLPGVPSRSQSPGPLPHPKEFELDDLENQPPRPPTPYPGLSRPIPAHSPQVFPQGRPQTLPLGFPVPPATGVNRMDSTVSRMTTISFQSAPRSVSPLSDVPPTPPPKPTVPRLESREPLLPPTASGGTVTQSDTRASIMTALCDAVQLSNPANEPGHVTQHYSPLMTGSSPASTVTGRDSGSIQSPRPTYPIELASPSRGREYRGREYRR
ncbi:hypothetical protein N8I77_012527 [Diaporthe amygdali]|uniref:Transmembrane protein n=1 Tax=Phomopsis amygdali TaxID=1214568 RepID=A0AAD9VYZ2_PHOAM|nr:hypothetical protein N8I77_012527 [Diaporthe amygdali]